VYAGSYGDIVIARYVVLASARSLATGGAMAQPSLPYPSRCVVAGSDLFGRQSLCRQGQYDLVDPLQPALALVADLRCVQQQIVGRQQRKRGAVIAPAR
jgi:hypothetical protein